MRTRSHAVLIALALALPAGAGGCKRKPSNAGNGPIPSEFGLDARPSNPTCLAPARPTVDSNVTLEPAFAGLPAFLYPVALLQKPGDGTRWYVVEKGGKVFTFANDPGVTSRSEFLNLTGTVSSGGFNSERGLLGMAFHPSFASNKHLFVSYTAGSSGTSKIVRFKSNDGGLTADPTSAAEFLSLNQPYANHNGGDIHFGPDGYLYIAFGDGGSAGDPGNRAQDPFELLGKILRIDVDGGPPYDVPSTNPFASGADGAAEVYALGMRNPWRFSFDRGTGELWAGDVGQDCHEEVDRIELGGNYGWRVREGSTCYDSFDCTPDPSDCPSGGYVDPVVDYPNPGEGQSITGGYVYRGSAIPALVGIYVFGDFASGTIWGIFHDDDGVPYRDVLVESGMAISSFGEGEDGELYVIDYADGRLHKIVPAGTAPADGFPQKLSETGCFDADDPTRPLPGLIPYTVNVPLWSDGAAKERYLAIPDGTTIGVDPESGDWDLPNGTVLVKTFTIGGQRIETRLLVRHDDGGWAGYTYEWDDEEIDATLLASSKARPVGSLTWGYPSRAECLQCHTEAAGRSLGLESAQLNRDFVYVSTNREANQIDTLIHIGMFGGTLPSKEFRYSSIHGNDTVEKRARSYLHANCSNCHRPGGTGQGGADLRAATAFGEMEVCNVDPQEGDLDIDGAKLLAPGEPDLSLLLERMKRLDSNRMPDIGTGVPDEDAIDVIEHWIETIPSCL